MLADSRRKDREKDTVMPSAHKSLFTIRYPLSADQNISDESGGSTSAGLREGIQSPVIIWS